MDWMELLKGFAEGAPELGVFLVASRDGSVVASAGDGTLFEEARRELPVFETLLRVRREPSLKLSFYRADAPLAFAMVAIIGEGGFFGDLVAVCRAERVEELAVRVKRAIYALQARGYSTHLDASLVDQYLRELKLEFDPP